MCCNCKDENGVCEKFLKINSPRPWKAKEEILCHGLVKCKTCKTMFNRDLNSSVNIRRIAENAINGLKRPEYLSRKLKIH
jgi:transposase